MFMKNENLQLKIVRLMDPDLCLTCNFVTSAMVRMADGTEKRMIHCRRLDCDNWEMEENQDVPRKIYDLSDLEY